MYIHVHLHVWSTFFYKQTITHTHSLASPSQFSRRISQFFLPLVRLSSWNSVVCLNCMWLSRLADMFSLFVKTFHNNSKQFCIVAASVEGSGGQPELLSHGHLMNGQISKYSSSLECQSSFSMTSWSVWTDSFMCLRWTIQNNITLVVRRQTQRWPTLVFFRNSEIAQTRKAYFQRSPKTTGT